MQATIVVTERLDRSVERIQYRPVPTEFCVLVAAGRRPSPFADHLLQSNAEAARYPLRVVETRHVSR